MGDMAEYDMEQGMDSWERHLNGCCEETECQYCMEQHWDGDTRDPKEE